MNLKGVIFDLDGVIVSTDEYHYKAWQRMADEEGIYFDRGINEALRGVSRMECMDIILKRADRHYTEEEKVSLGERKNEYYKHMLKEVTPEDILPSVMNLLKELKCHGIKTAIGSSSKNAPIILERIGLDKHFDAVADGNQIKNSKPHPEVFLLAAQMLETVPEECLVVEDAEAGVEAALAGNMKVVGVGSAANSDKAHYKVKDLSFLNLLEVFNLFD
jgi:beta-phosphoglucomutase